MISPVPQTRLQLVSGLFQSVDPARLRPLLERVYSAISMPGFSEARVRIQAALGQTDEAVLETARHAILGNHPTLLALIPYANELAEAAGLGSLVAELERGSAVFGAPPVFEDVRVEDAWERLITGAGALHGFHPALYAPVGALAVGAIHLLDRRGLQAHGQAPPSFGIFVRGRESPGRIAQYNLGETSSVGNVAFDFPPELQMAVVPSTHLSELRRRAPIQFVMPASEVLAEYFAVDWARDLPQNATIVSGVKGLVTGGKTPLEYFAEVFREAGRSDICVVDVLGYLPSSAMMREQRETLAGKSPTTASWDVVLTSNFPLRAVALAKRWAGPGVVEREENYQGVPVIVVENNEFVPPLRMVIVTDPDVIRANELASVYKNLEALQLGRLLLEEMFAHIHKGRRADATLASELNAFYQRHMQEAERDMERVLELESIPKAKAVILPEVRNDLYGSWGTQNFLEMYQLAWSLLRRDASKEEWSEAMVLLKRRIRGYYSVRNPCYGFCLAADRAAVLMGRWLSQEEVAETIRRLQQKGLIPADEPIPEGNDSPHFFFSMIPEGLVPEGLQVAELLRERYRGDRFRRLPQSFREAHLLVERIQRQMFFAPEIQRSIVDLSLEAARILPGSAEVTRERFLEIGERLYVFFERALRILRAGERIYPQQRQTQAFVAEQTRMIRQILDQIRANERLGSQEICLLNQAMLEALTRANLFYILPPTEVRQQVAYLRRRLGYIAEFAIHGGGPGALAPTDEPFGSTDLPLVPILSGVRERLFEKIGEGLIALTHDMSAKIYEEGTAISRASLVRAVGAMTTAIETAKGQIDADSPPDDFLFGILKTLHDIRGLVESRDRKLNGHERLRIFQALIEAMIHARRFLIYPPEQAAVEVRYTVKRFERIRDFLRGETGVSSPLWYFSTGKTLRPVPART